MAGYVQVIQKLRSLKNPKNIEGMARFGINSKNTLGISIYDLRKIAKEIGKDHQLALKLWDSGIHEARILAGFVDEPEKVTEAQLEKWVKDFDSWDTVDQVSELIAHTPFAVKKIPEWSRREEEFVRRTAFSLIAELAWWNKALTDRYFEQLFPLIKSASVDERNYVRKSVNWALRNIGKRNKALNRRAIAVAKEIRKIDSKSARWIAADALRELTSPVVQARLTKKS
ncbi:DNA alkylation repair protein [candidate division WWE3 bacterium RBG_16_52_45]|nr:MAG: DNA alkylation repair protein [candidate division WWE3 bacterium RBG_16_52_45]